MEELARFNTYLEMLDPMRGGYRCVMYDKALVDTFPKKSKTRIILDIDDGNIQVQAGIQSFGGGKYFSMIGKTKLGGHTYEQGQAISVVIYLDPNPLGGGNPRSRGGAPRARRDYRSRLEQTHRRKKAYHLPHRSPHQKHR